METSCFFPHVPTNFGGSGSGGGWGRGVAFVFSHMDRVQKIEETQVLISILSFSFSLGASLQSQGGQRNFWGEKHFFLKEAWQYLGTSVGWNIRCFAFWVLMDMSIRDRSDLFHLTNPGTFLIDRKS